MHQTTVRFSADLWAQLEEEAQRSGVSAAQYVRDSTLARLSYTAGQRGDHPYGSNSSPEPPHVTRRDNFEESTAVWEQARLARARARTVRTDAQAAQARVRERPERPPRSS
jgi:hypothetical protein